MKKELPPCPVALTLSVIGGKWKIMILRELIDGTKRFNELMRRIESVSHKVLTAQLRELERDGFITRTVVKEVPPHVEYDLTKLGWTIKPILDSMDDWGEWYREKLESESSTIQ